MDNKLKFIPNFLDVFQNLTELDLVGNRLLLIPDVVSLHLGGNKIHKLSDLSCLTNLEVLSLSYNHLVSLPPSISNLTNLKELYLSNNLLESKKIIFFYFLLFIFLFFYFYYYYFYYFEKIEFPEPLLSMKFLKKFSIHNNPFLKDFLGQNVVNLGSMEINETIMSKIGIQFEENQKTEEIDNKILAKKNNKKKKEKKEKKPKKEKKKEKKEMKK